MVTFSVALRTGSLLAVDSRGRSLHFFKSFFYIITVAARVILPSVRVLLVIFGVIVFEKILFSVIVLTL